MILLYSCMTPSMVMYCLTQFAIVHNLTTGKLVSIDLRKEGRTYMCLNMDPISTQYEPVYVNNIDCTELDDVEVCNCEGE